jgi:hypothetical protein
MQFFFMCADLRVFWRIMVAGSLVVVLKYKIVKQMEAVHHEADWV